MRKIKKKGELGFVVLYAIVISGIMLAVTLGVMNISLKEINFSTSGEDTNEAFFAADAGIECALFNDKSASNSFKDTGGSGTVTCLGGSVPISMSSSSGPPPSTTWSFVLSGLGGGSGCSKVSVKKFNEGNPPMPITKVTSQGYNAGDSSCNSTSLARVERQLEATYYTPPPPQASYRYVRLDITKRKNDPNSNSIQVSELVLLQNGSNVPWPSGTVATNPGGNNPVNEGPPKAIDGSTATKWLDFNFAANGVQTGLSRLKIDTGSGNSVIFNGYKWATANDAVDRDPISWTLYGSNNDSTYAIIGGMSDATITNSRQTYTPSYCAGPVVLFQHTSYGGYGAGFWPGTYTLAQLQSCGVSDNDISSIRVVSGYKATLYENNNFGGATLVKTSDDSTLVDDGWNDRMSSLKVETNP